MTDLPISDEPQSPGRWYVVGLGAATVFFVFAASTACMPVLFSEISEKLDLNIVQIGTIWGASAMTGIFSILAAGMLADRYGTKRTIVIGCIIAGTFGALRGLSDGFSALFITTLLYGIASESVPVIVVKNTSLWFHGRSLGMAQGIITAGVGGGMMLSAMFSATVLSPLLGGWDKVVFLYGGLSILVGIAWLLTVKNPPRTGTQESAVTSSPRQALSHLFRIKGVWLVAIAMLGFAGCNRGVAGYIPLYLKDKGWTATGADGALAVLNAAGTIGAVPLAALSDKIGLRKAVLLPGVILSAITCALLAIITGPSAWILVIVFGAVRDMVWAMAATIIVETKGVGLAYAGTAVGVVHTFTRVGYTFAPPLGNSLEEIQPGSAFLLWAAMAVVAVIAFFFVKETGHGK